MLNTTQTICSQYGNSPTLLQLVQNMNQYLDPRANMLAFYDNVWNVDSAEGFGLNIWGRIVGVSRVIPIPGTSGYFGFANSDVPPDWQNYGNANGGGGGGPFFNGEVSTGSFTLNDTAYRTLILTKALANIVSTTSPALNQLLQNLFPGRGASYVVDRGKMGMSYVFTFPLTTIEYAILAFSGVLPGPAGVLVNTLVIPSGYFGFAESGPAQNGFIETGATGAFYSVPGV
jgi:Protein of unknown function (DUF2612)